MTKVLVRHEDCGYDTDLIPVRILQPDYHVVVLNEILRQCKIPVCRLSFETDEGSKVLIASETEEGLVLDQMLAGGIIWEQMHQKELLFRYAVLCLILGVEHPEERLKIIKNKQLNFEIINEDVELISGYTEFPWSFLLKTCAGLLQESKLRQELDILEVLMDENMENKVLGKLTEYQNYFDEDIRKTEMVRNVLNSNHVNDCLNWVRTRLSLQ